MPRSRFISPAAPGFTLLELLITMAGVAILASLTWNAMSSVQELAYRNQAKTQIQAIALALEAYQLDQGDYPEASLPGQPEPSPDPYEYRQAAQLLFQALTGTSTMGQPPQAPTYFPLSQKGSIAHDFLGDYFVDPWGNPYGYRRNALNEGYQPGFYDLWSTGGSTQGTEKQKAKWIVNWPDSIRERIL